MSDLSKETLEDLLKRKKELESPGAWDFDPDARYTRNYFLCEINEELRRRGYNENV